MRIGSLDFGLKKDWAVFVVIDGDSRNARLMHKKIWKGTSKRQVSVSDTELYIKQAINHFQLDLMAIEQWQMVATIERLRNEVACPIEEFVPTGQSVVAISECFFQYVQRGSFKFPLSDNHFRSEMLELEAEEAKSAGLSKTAFKIIYKTHAGGYGHGDTTRAISIGLYYLTTKYVRPGDEILKDVSTGHAGATFGKGEKGNPIDSVGGGVISGGGGENFFTFGGSMSLRENNSEDYDDE